MDATDAQPPFSVEAWSYRDAEQPLRAQREALLRRRRRELSELPAALQRTYGRRVARSAAGAAAITGAIAVLVDALLSKLGEGDPQHRFPALTVVLLATLAAIPVVYLLARAVAERLLLRRLARELRPTRDVVADVARLAHRSAPALAAEAADPLERRSVAWPMVGASLILPLSLHLPVAMMLTRPSVVQSFDWWIGASLVLVLPAHLVLAFMSWRFARDLRRHHPESPRRVGSGWGAYAWTCVAGLVPGVVLFAIPPILVAVTGIAFIPAMFSIMRRRVLDERLLFEAATAATVE